MGLFECSTCGSVDNTALGHYWGATEPKCSACLPATKTRYGDYPPYGEWHNVFERKTVAEWRQKNPDIEISIGSMFAKKAR